MAKRARVPTIVHGNTNRMLFDIELDGLLSTYCNDSCCTPMHSKCTIISRRKGKCTREIIEAKIIFIEGVKCVSTTAHRRKCCQGIKKCTLIHQSCEIATWPKKDVHMKGVFPIKNLLLEALSSVGRCALLSFMSTSAAVPTIFFIVPYRRYCVSFFFSTGSFGSRRSSDQHQKQI